MLIATLSVCPLTIEAQPDMATLRAASPMTIKHFIGGSPALLPAYRREVKVRVFCVGEIEPGAEAVEIDIWHRQKPINAHGGGVSLGAAQLPAALRL